MEEKDLVIEEVACEHLVRDRWIDFRRSDYRFPDGRVFGPYYTYSRRDYAVIVASDEEGRFLCVRQFRPGLRQVTTEFPAGGLERKDGEPYTLEKALAAAKRELREETGLTAENWVHLTDLNTTPGFCDELISIYLATGLTRGDDDPDEDEFLNIVRMPLHELVGMARRGEIEDGKTMVGLLLAEKQLKEARHGV